MAEKPYGLTRRDLARVNRVVTAYEAATDPPNSDRRLDAPRPMQWMLIEPFARAADHAPTDLEGLPPLGRYLTAQAVPCDPTDLRVQVIRQHVGWPGSVTFRLSFRGVQTNLLSLTSTAATVYSELNSISALNGKITVRGYQTECGPDLVPFLGRQWHIQFSDDVEQGALLELVGNAIPLRLFQDWWWPDFDDVRTVWAGMPTDARLQPGAFGWVLPYGLQGLTWMHGECYTWEE